MIEQHQDLHTRVGQLNHRVEAIRLALAHTTLDEGVRLVLMDHLGAAEEALLAAEAEAPGRREIALSRDALERAQDEIERLRRDLTQLSEQLAPASARHGAD